MSRYTITPWRSQKDLLHVRQQLYGLGSKNATNITTTQDQRRTAVSQVAAWKLRGNLPHAIESTALLTDAILHHESANSGRQEISSFSIRAVYSAAFTRFVTGFCDIGRSRERALEPSSMLVIARQIGMPAEFVALRHEATHDEMPGLKRLVDATTEALGWLWRVYWSRLEEVDSEGKSMRDFAGSRVELETLLKGFRRDRRDALRGGKDEVEQVEAVRRAVDDCVNMCDTDETHVETFATVLVEDRLLLPASRELGSSLDGAFLIWDNFLLDVFERLPRARHSLVCSLLRSLAVHSPTVPAQDVVKEGVAMWVNHVLLGGRPVGSDSSSERHLQVKAMKWCCLHPGYWSEFVGRELLEHGDSDLCNDWAELFSASVLKTSGQVIEGVEQDNRQFKKAHSEERSRAIDILEGDIGDPFTAPAGGWSRAIAPVSVPIGVLPG